MRELGYTPLLSEGGQTVVTGTGRFMVVQSFPVVEVKDPYELVVPPREYRTLVERPAVREAA